MTTTGGACDGHVAPREGCVTVAWGHMTAAAATYQLRGQHRLRSCDPTKTRGHPQPGRIEHAWLLQTIEPCGALELIQYNYTTRVGRCVCENLQCHLLSTNAPSTGLLLLPSPAPFCGMTVKLYLRQGLGLAVVKV